MSFEKFTKTGRGFRPKISIWSRGQIGFNQGAMRWLNVESFGYVIFYYDADTKRVGFELTNDEHAEGANKIKVRQTGASVGAKAYLDYYRIDYRKTRSYDVELDKASNLYVVDLTKAEDAGDTEDAEVEGEEEEL